MPVRRICRRHLVCAAILVALAVLPRLVHVYAGVWYTYDPVGEQPNVSVYILRNTPWLVVNVSSLETATSVGTAWRWYRHYWWVPAAVAACIVIRELLPIPRVFGTDDDEHCG